MSTRNIAKQELPLEQRIKAKIAAIDAVANDVPGVIIIHNLQKDASVAYMSPRGLEQLGISLEELQKKAGREYHETFFNAEEAKEYVPKLIELVTRNAEGESLSYFQQVKPSPNATNFIWHMSTTKILMRDEENRPLLIITTSYPIDPAHEFTQKVSRLLDQNTILRKNYKLFAQLSKREKEVLKLMSIGKSSPEIAAALFISAATAETHRRNVKQKLKASSLYEVAQYAQAFDLI
ncbi:MAG: LuxR family transcriptional regulator [Sphingobacteriales bacterium]|nr:MAG: LuxR family transcriptional regulator [Sphingobacteriales bacterium]